MEHSDVLTDLVSSSLVGVAGEAGALARSRNLLWVDVLVEVSKNKKNQRVDGCLYLNSLRPFCQPRLHSTLILTQRKMTSSPPLKSMPSWTISPSLTGYGRLSMPGLLRRMWFKKVPELLLQSLMYHWLLVHQNSQWFRLTTLLLKPTGATVHPEPAPWLSRSE